MSIRIAHCPHQWLQDLNSFSKGKELFREGLLSEARLALEAEVQRQPGNVEAWRLLGTVHAENDNDQQVLMCFLQGQLASLSCCSLRALRSQWLFIIPFSTFGQAKTGVASESGACGLTKTLYKTLHGQALHCTCLTCFDDKAMCVLKCHTPLQAIAALNKALLASPGNAEVLLSLGVSYTNELDQRRAITYLMEWLKLQPHQSRAASIQLPNDGREKLRVVVDIFRSAAQMVRHKSCLSTSRCHQYKQSRAQWLAFKNWN